MLRVKRWNLSSFRNLERLNVLNCFGTSPGSIASGLVAFYSFRKKSL